MDTAIVTEDLSDEPLVWLGARMRVVRGFPGEPAFETDADRCAALIVRTYTQVDTALLDGEIVRPQPGDAYAGWVTNRIKGPIKGAPGTEHW